MKNATARCPVNSWKAVASAAFLLLILFSCINPQKVAKWNDKHPLKAAEYAEKNFPCRPGDTTLLSSSVDSGAYNESIQELNESLDSLNAINDTLIWRLMHVDTSCRQYIKQINTQKSQISNLKSQIKDIRPKIITNDHIITVIDSSKAVATRLKNEELIQTNNDQQKKIMELSAKSKIRFWMLVSAGLLNLLLLFFLFKRKSNPINKLQKLQ